MKALIVYDSFFGNTQKIAEAIGKALGGKVTVPVVKVADVKPEELLHLDYLIFGSPTRAFQPSPAITKILKGIPSSGLKGSKVAAFDTRISVEDTPVAILRFFSKIFGYAAKTMAGNLVKKGGTLAVPPEGFFVKGSEGPLKEGELERASAWTKQILNSK
jgi:flavodoxin I